MGETCSLVDGKACRYFEKYVLPIAAHHGLQREATAYLELHGHATQRELFAGAR